MIDRGGRTAFGLVAAFALLSSLLLGGCDSAAPPMAVEAAAPVSSAGAPGPATGEYHLGTGDKVRVVVFNEPALSGEFQIDDSGQVSIPLVGQLKAAGLSPRDLEQQVTRRLKGGGLVRDPRVSVEVSNYRPFYLIGEVAKPGEYPYRNGLTILAAAAIGGGFTYRASRSKVFIKRASESIEREYPMGPTTNILPGDVIRIPERSF